MCLSFPTVVEKDSFGVRTDENGEYMPNLSAKMTGFVITFAVLAAFQAYKNEYVAMGLDKISDEEEAKLRAESADMESCLKGNAKFFIKADIEGLISALIKYTESNFSEVEIEKWNKLMATE